MTNNHRTFSARIVRFIGLGLLFFALTGTTCVEERQVDVVVGADIIVEFVALGQINTFDGEEVVSIDDQIDIDKILADNGIDSIQDVSVQSAFFRVTQKDPAAGRTITGSIGVRRDPADAESELIHLSTVSVNEDAYADWTPVPLEAAGVNVLNGVLDELLNPVQPSPLTVIFHSAGTSTPLDVPTNFRYEVKVRLNVVGVVSVDVINGV